MVQKKLGSMSRSNSIWLSQSKQDRPNAVKRLEIVEFQAFKNVRVYGRYIANFVTISNSNCRGAAVGNAGKPWPYLDFLVIDRHRQIWALYFFTLQYFLNWSIVYCGCQWIGPDHLQNMCLKSRKKQLDQTYSATYNQVDDPKLVWMLLVFSGCQLSNCSIIFCFFFCDTKGHT